MGPNELRDNTSTRAMRSRRIPEEKLRQKITAETFHERAHMKRVSHIIVLFDFIEEKHAVLW
jgi:hypothetical protein